MRKLNQIASALTIAAVTFGAGAAYADCAADLAAMRGELNVTASTAGSPPAAGESMSADGAGTASVGSSAATAGSPADTAASTTGAAETPEVKDQTAAASGGETYTQSPAATGAAGSEPSATGQVSGVAPTAAVGDVAAAGTTTGGGAAAAAASGGGTAAATTPDAAATGDAGNQMVMTHIAEAQTALDAGDEAACMKALESAKGAM